jgi:hypothetical protein
MIYKISNISNKQRRANTQNAFRDRHYYFLLPLLFASLCYFLITRLMFFNILVMFLFLFCMFFSILRYPRFCIVLYIFSFVYSYLLFFTSLLTAATGWKLNCSKYISYHHNTTIMLEDWKTQRVGLLHIC